MKKVVLLLVSCFVVLSATNAQGFDFGVKAGYLYSDIDEVSVDALKTEGNSGYFLGVFTRFSSKSWFFQPEVQYRVRSSEVVSVSDAIKGKVDVEMKTIDIPLQVGTNLLDLPMIRLALHAGPTLSFNVADDTTIKNEISNFDIDKFTDYKSFIWSGQIGLTADISRFTVGVAYEKGFSDISDGLGKNNLVLVNVGLRF
ncbi:outer membrane protein with beta-barrel domain [Balneicella halophila]|uniref:Outer membrane protein with beta-barrel domain n=1 Tax=Balneicella halophila TaxID=1537566 RepID=A0A7L4UST5_BALHA|nr:porin family protein [Balneicella halophila]PVX52521.1 outer membrane protein with beta-barrel domain [Balneicella halophila]